MVNVRPGQGSLYCTVPKSVPSSRLGVVSPSLMDTPLYRTVISGSPGITVPVIRKLKGFSSGSSFPKE